MTAQKMQVGIRTPAWELQTRGDETLVSLANAGDEGAIRVLIRRHNQQADLPAAAFIMSCNGHLRVTR